MSVSCPGSASRPAAVRVAPLAAAPARAYRRSMPLYVVPRTRAWLSEEELAAATDCLPAVNDALGDVRWIRSYVVAEPDGTFTAYCVYEASDPEALRRHGDAMMLPTDAIQPVAATLVAASDPEPVRAV
jgi:hypothetical protein